MILRERHLAAVVGKLARRPVVALLGARQVGKTTLAKQVVNGRTGDTTWFDLEDDRDLARLADPQSALAPLRGTVVIDEVQRRPEIFPTLRVLADRPRKPARFLVLGSASPELLRQGSESLAGRIAYHDLQPLTTDETGPERLERLWLRGGFPRAFTARANADSQAWRADFVRSFVERDLPLLGPRVASQTIKRFWTMLAHYHGQIWNATEFGRALGANDKTARAYLDLLCSTFVVRRLLPWHENLGKRQVKSPKVYVADPGLLHVLLGIASLHDLRGHPKAGASWEGLLLSEVTARLGAAHDETYFWSAHAGPEIDLLVVRGRQRVGVEFKLSSAPRASRSLLVSRDLLGLDATYLVHAGEHTFDLGDGIRAVAAARIWQDIEPLR